MFIVVMATFYLWIASSSRYGFFVVQMAKRKNFYQNKKQEELDPIVTKHNSFFHQEGAQILTTMYRSFTKMWVEACQL